MAAILDKVMGYKHRLLTSLSVRVMSCMLDFRYRHELIPSRLDEGGVEH